MDKLVTLKQNYEFHRAYTKGKSCVSPVLVTYCVKKKKDAALRFGITSGKKIGCAVERNRARRVIRAAARELIPEMNCGWDIVFVARSATAACKSYEIKKVMQRHLITLGIIS